MPQQLSLYSSVPDSELKVSLHTLVALTGQRPRSIFSHSLVFIPIGSTTQPNTSTHEQYRLRLETDGLSGPSDVHSYVKDPTPLLKLPWTMIVAELPEAGKRRVVSQALLSTQIQHTPFEFITNLGYEFSSEYWVRGYQFTYGQIRIHLFRLCVVDPDSGNLQLLDKTGRWTIKAFTDVALVTDIEGINMGTQSLEALKADLTGLLNLGQPDRNSFDTRMRRLR